MNDSLGDRMKRYEKSTRYVLSPNSFIIVRVDGKAFHSLKLEKPFDSKMMNAMATSAYHVSTQMQGFKMAYVQSDEATFLLTDTDSNETQLWFGGNLSKIISISAAYMTAYFNRLFQPETAQVFDARAFYISEEDWPNCFIWRQQDWERNSIQMYARAFFSHKELHKKSMSDIHEMLHGIGKNWAKDLNERQKNGTLFSKEHMVNYKFNYGYLKELYKEENYTSTENQNGTLGL